MDLIKIQHLQFQYPAGDFHLTMNDFKVARTEKVAVIGPSGSGNPMKFRRMSR